VILRPERWRGQRKSERGARKAAAPGDVRLDVGKVQPDVEGGADAVGENDLVFFSDCFEVGFLQWSQRQVQQAVAVAVDEVALVGRVRVALTGVGGISVDWLQLLRVEEQLEAYS
jgi:hypothetical protein